MDKRVLSEFYGHNNHTAQVRLNRIGEGDMFEVIWCGKSVGIYNTEQLLKLLSVLDEDINTTISKAGDKSIALKVTDSSSSVNYMLSDVSIINKPPQLKMLPEFELSIDVTPQFISKFIAGKSALSETDNFTVITDDTSTKLVIGYASINTNRVTIPVECEEFSDTEPISFNANMFANILQANKECEKAVLKVSSDGLATISFNIDDYKSDYFLVATQQVT